MMRHVFAKCIPQRLLPSLLLVAVSGVVCCLPAGAEQITRGPYLQMQTPHSVVIRWRTATEQESAVWLGSHPEAIEVAATRTALTTEHEVLVDCLTPDTRYYYAVGFGARQLANGPDYWFRTAPPHGKRGPVRAWVLGDSGTMDANARRVRDAMQAEIEQSGRGIDLWLMLGDNAYPDGTDDEYQKAVFEMYPTFLRNYSLWSTLGNHDGHSAHSPSQTGVYYDIFSLPRNGEAGGLPSGTEAYYSFDYANIHFICLDSYDTPRGANDPMARWAAEDAMATTQDWIIAFFHHPPYSKGSHDSDVERPLVEMRENLLPVLEAAGVDLVLAGHSHSYERSYLLRGAFHTPTLWRDDVVLDKGDGREDGDGAYQKRIGRVSGNGTVYVVAGSSGKLSSGSFDHPLMYYSLKELGSLVLDVDGDRLDAFFLDNKGEKRDHFTMLKQPAPVMQVDVDCFPDVDGDCVVTEADLQLVMDAMGSENGGPADTNRDGVVDMRDLHCVARNMGMEIPDCTPAPVEADAADDQPWE